MINNTIDPNKFPLCKDVIERINNQFINNGWITLYDETYTYSVLISNDKLEKTKCSDSWKLNMNNSHPIINEFEDSASGYSQYYEDGVVPIVTYQSEKSTYPKRLRLSDEFILFYDLRDVQNNDCIEYHIVDECGDGECIAKITSNQVIAQIKYIKEFIAVKEMPLLIQFETLKDSNKSLKDNGFVTQHYKLYNTDEYVFGYSLMDGDSITTYKSYALIRGKVWIMPEQKNIKKLWNYQDHRKENFIIGVDENGDNIEITCDENKLPNLFNRKDAEPYVLTPVFFKKEVLRKYYSEPNKFSVNEGFINGPEWWLRIDNDRKDNYIVATLVDLGKIPYKEQQYWRSFNITPPPMAELSETTKRRWFDGEACNTCDAQDFLFKQTLLEVNNLWNKKNNWQLFKPLTKGDEHHIDSLHTMFSQNNNLEFDGLIQSITKIVIDSLNEKEIIKNTDDSMDVVQKFLSEKKCSKASDLKGGIAKFEVYLLSFGYSDTEIIKLMKDIQKLRSTSVAHRKSSKPDNEQQQLFARLGLNNSSQQEVFNNLLSNLTLQLNWLKENLIDN